MTTTMPDWDMRALQQLPVTWVCWRGAHDTCPGSFEQDAGTTMPCQCHQTSDHALPRPESCPPWCAFVHVDNDDLCMSESIGAFPVIDKHGDPVTQSLTLFAGGTLPVSVMVGDDLYSPAAARDLAFTVAYAAAVLEPEDSCKCRPDIGKPGVLTFTQPVDLQSGDIAALLADEASSDDLTGPLTLPQALTLLRARLAHGWADEDRGDWVDQVLAEEAAARRVWAVEQVRALWPHLDDEDLFAFLTADPPGSPVTTCAHCGHGIEQRSGEWSDIEYGTPYCTRRASHQPREVAS